MVKASNLIKKLLPVGVVIGGLLLLSQSKRVNVFRTTQPSLTIKQAAAIPILFEKTNLVPIFQQEQLTPKNAQTLLEQEYGTLYTKERVRADRQIELGAERYKWTKEFKDVFTAL